MIPRLVLEASLTLGAFAAHLTVRYCNGLLPRDIALLIPHFACVGANLGTERLLTPLAQSVTGAGANKALLG